MPPPAALLPSGRAAAFSIVSRDDIHKARQAALDDCGKRGKSCKIIGSLCADGTGLSSSN